eukprot:m.174360 g.174360  ORF g.174360 m.174360 type:complete len:89 (-) comp31765_c2_seq4:112-378(-)
MCCIFRSYAAHESLPLETSQHRQFFRLVTSDVSVWYSQHSDENPLGIKADPKTTITLDNNKFQTPTVAHATTTTTTTPTTATTNSLDL